MDVRNLKNENVLIRLTVNKFRRKFIKKEVKMILELNTQNLARNGYQLSMRYE